MVNGEQQEGFEQLGLDGRGADDHDGLAREHGRPLRHGVNIAGEAEGAQIFQKFLAENALAAQVRNVLLVKVQILDVFDELLEARRDGKAAAVRDRAEINVKIGDAIFEAGLEIAVAHGQLVEIAEHGHVQFFFRFHGTPHINSAAVRSPRPYDALIIARFYG